MLTDIDLSVRTGERIVICGPSGSGKSTLIRCINRLETVQKGRIVVDGIDLTAGGKNVDAVRAEVGMVFQQFNLFPHLTILQNCTLAPMRSRGMTQGAGRGDRDEVPHARAHSRAGRTSTRASSRAASSSAWRLRARCA